MNNRGAHPLRRAFVAFVTSGALLLAIFLAAAPPASAQQDGTPSTVPSAAQFSPQVPDVVATLTEIARRGDTVVAGYGSENALASAQQMSELYFNQFESLEGILGSSDKTAMVAMESAFGRVNSLMMRGYPKEDVTAAWRALREKLEDTAHRHAAAAADGSAGSPGVLFVQSFLILLREGAEAILVVAALAAYLRRGDAPTVQIRAVYGAAGLAVIASLITAWAMNALLAASGAAREGFEGITMLIAAAMLFYVGAWLFARRDAERWRAYLQEQTKGAAAALERGSSQTKALVMLGATSFLAVYREGVETVIFYQAVLNRAGGQETMVAAGFAAALVALALLFVVVRVLSLRLPLKPFFVVTAALLYAMAVVFAGHGVMELQNAGWLPRTSLALPDLPTFGVFASAEGLGLQLALAALIAVAAWRLSRARGI